VRPQIIAPVGKSGPLIIFESSSIVVSGLSISLIAPFITSVKLCGGMFVAIPTAIPDEPLTNRFGNFAGRTFGSSNDSSKLGIQSTVSFSKSASISSAIEVSLVSV